MKAAIVKNDRIEIIQTPKPVLNEKGAVIKLHGCGLCGSDIVKLKQKPGAQGTVLGHEIVGEIAEINSDTDFCAGDKIVMGHHVPCFKCIYCKNKNYSMCAHFKKTNIVPGGFSEYIFASEEHLKNTVFKIPGALDEVSASFLEPLGCCVRSIERAQLLPGSSALVAGLGSIGLIMGQALKAYSHNVIGCDLIKERAVLAESLNFDKAIVFENDEKTTAEIKKHTDGYGVDAVFMTSGSFRTIPFALKAVRDGGKIIVFASVANDSGYENNAIYYRELTVLGSYSPAPADLKKSLELLENKKIMVKNLSKEYNFDEIEKAISDTLENKIIKAYIKL